MVLQLRTMVSTSAITTSRSTIMVISRAVLKKVRPYLGLGFGRLIPKGRIGFRFELGAQFQGKPKVYAGDIDNVLENKQVTDAVDEETKDDIAKVMDWLKVYPVMKFSIRGRIL